MDMRENKNQNQEILTLSEFVTTEPLVHKSYHELSDTTLLETDILTQLKYNVEMLEDLQARFSFVMREVHYLMKR